MEKNPNEPLSINKQRRGGELFIFFAVLYSSVLTEDLLFGAQKSCSLLDTKQERAPLEAEGPPSLYKMEQKDNNRFIQLFGPAI